MNKLIEMELFSLLSETSQKVMNEELKSAYGNFMEQVESISKSENNLLEIFRILNITRIELVFVESLYRYEQGGKCA